MGQTGLHGSNRNETDQTGTEHGNILQIFFLLVIQNWMQGLFFFLFKFIDLQIQCWSICLKNGFGLECLSARSIGKGKIFQLFFFNLLLALIQHRHRHYNQNAFWLPKFNMVRGLNCQVQILSLNPRYLTFICNNERRQILTSRIYLMVESNYQQQIHIFVESNTYHCSKFQKHQIYP